jgi:hypothetical protein
LWKPTIIFVVIFLSVHPSTLKSQLSANGFSRYLTCQYFLKICWENQVPLKSGKNNGYFTARPTFIYDNIVLNCNCNCIVILFTFRRSIQDSKIHVDMDIVIYNWCNVQWSLILNIKSVTMLIFYHDISWRADEFITKYRFGS